MEANRLKPIDEIRGDAKIVNLPLHIYLDHQTIERMLFWTLLKCRARDLLDALIDFPRRILNIRKK